MRAKLSSSRGASLIEMLTALLVASLVAMAMSVGVSTALKIHRQSVEFSRSQVLFSTLYQAVSDQLHYAEDVQTAEDGTVSFTSKEYGAQRTLDVNGKGQVILRSATEETDSGQLLVGSGAYSDGELKAELLELSFDYTQQIFKAELQIQDQGGKTLKARKLVVRPLNLAATPESASDLTT